MMTQSQRDTIFKRGKPKSLWEGEPFLGSTYGEDEIAAVVAAMRDSFEVSRGFGFSASPIPEFEQAFADYVGTRYAVAINSAGPGLDMAMHFLKLQPGDEVIVPAINFVAAPLAVVGAGGQIVWGEVDPKTLQLDPNDCRETHYAKNPRDLPRAYEWVIRAHERLPGTGAALSPRPARTIGRHWRRRPSLRRRVRPWKNRQERVVERILVPHHEEHDHPGRGRPWSRPMTRTVDAFCRATRFYGATLDIWGTSNVMTKVQAATGLVQLKQLDSFIAGRRRLAKLRDEMLGGVPELTLPFEPADCEHSYYLYTCLVPSEWAGAKRDLLMKMMDETYGVRCVVANKAVYTYRKILREHTPGQYLPLSESLGERLFCVPIHPAMSDEDNEYICASVISCVEALR